MDMIAIIAYLGFLAVSLLLYKRLSNPIVFFNLIWLVWITISATGIMGFYAPGGHIYKMFIIGGAIFNLFGYLFMFIAKIVSSKKNYSKTKTTAYYEYRRILFIVLQIIIFAYYVSEAITLFASLKSGMSYSEVRGYYYSEENFSSSFEYRMVTFLFDPMVMVSEIVFAINIFDKQYNKFVTLIMLCNIFLRAITSAGRMIVFELALFIVINFIYQYRTYIKYKKGKLKVGIIVSLATIVAGYMTSGRFGSENTATFGTMESLLSNFTGSFTYLNILYRNGVYTTPKFGSVTFAGITDGFRMLTNGLGLTNFSLVKNEIGLMLMDYEYIGNKFFNAMPSMYYYFICDFGTHWYFLGLIVLAFITVIIYSYCHNTKSCKALALYLLLMMMIAESSMTWMPSNTSFVIAFVYAFFFLSNDKLPKIKQKTGVSEQ